VKIVALLLASLALVTFGVAGSFAATPDLFNLHPLAQAGDFVVAMGMMIPASAKMRGIVAVKAESGDVPGLIAGLNREFSAFKERQDGRVEGLQKAVDGLNAKFAAHELGAGMTPGDNLVDPEYTKAFASWSRGGTGGGELLASNKSGKLFEINAAMSTSPGEAGGYLAPIEWDRRVVKALETVSPMRRLATVITTTVRGYSTLWNMGGWGSGWVGETAARPGTSNATLKPIEFAHGEIYAMPSVTQQLLDDADFPLDEWLATELAEEFSRQEDPAFISGNGASKPNGLLTYVTGGSNASTHPGGAIAPSVAASATVIASDELVDFVYSLKAPYRQNAAWLMNSTTAALIAKMKDGDGNYLWRETYVAGQPATLLGYPVEIDENMPDVAADALPIAFGDFKRGYVINDRMGVRILRDPYTNKPYVNFYATKRVGAGLLDPQAIKVIQMAAAA